MAQNYAKASERTSSMIKADVTYASPQLRRNITKISIPATTQNTTTYTVWSVPANIGVSGIKITAASVVFGVAPAVSGGTCTLALTKYASDGVTTVSVADAATILSKTAFVSFNLTLATTNPTAILAGESVAVVVATSNNAVGTAQSGGTVSIEWVPVEDTTISE